MQTEPKIKVGKYKHYKGKFYEVLYLATHSETEEKMVVYKLLYGDFSIWVRPYQMFIESIERDGKKVKRFEYVGAE